MRDAVRPGASLAPDRSGARLPWTLLLHGDDDQIVPIDTTAQRVVKMIKGART